MKRLTWFLAMTVPTILFLFLIVFINEYVIHELIKLVLGYSFIIGWFVYVITIWTIPDRDGGFTK